MGQVLFVTAALLLLALPSFGQQVQKPDPFAGFDSSVFADPEKNAPPKAPTLSDIQKMGDEYKARMKNVSVLRCVRGACVKKDVPSGLQGPLELVIASIGFALVELKFLTTVPITETKRYKAAVAGYQESLHSRPTGDLLYWEWSELNDRKKFIEKYNSLDFMHLENLRIDADDTYVSLSGAWRVPGDVTNTIPNSTTIFCTHAELVCNEDYTDYIFQIDHSRTVWRIVQWTKEEITAANEDGRCVFMKLVIRPSEMMAKTFRITRQNTKLELCNLANPQDLVLTLVDGYEYMAEYRSKQGEKALTYYNPEYSNSVRALMKYLEKQNTSRKE